jgi:G3E family GTPase
MTPLPVSVLTGFLGAGKTTLLARALRDPGLAGTLVLVNEAGEIALDHLLLEAVEEQVVTLPSGCLCCVVREDMARALSRIGARRRAGDLPGVARIVIETSGLADPAPLLYTLAALPELERDFRLDTVVTLVDSALGERVLARHVESARQVAIADRILLSKCDIAEPSAALLARLDGLNAAAERFRGSDVRDLASLLFRAAWQEDGRRGRWFRCEPAAPQSAHGDGIATHSLVLDRPPTRLDFARMLGRLAAERGEDLLRLKGLVEFADQPGAPVLINAVQHTLYAPERLLAWPDDDRRSRLVVIASHLPREDLLDYFAGAEARAAAA